VREDSPRWEQINPSPFAHEQDGLRLLASYLPDKDPYHVWANVEFVGTDGSINEVDALVLTPGGLYVLELKHWRGEIRGDGAQWVRRAPNSRLIPEDNPYILANRKAKRLASLIRFYAKQQRSTFDPPYVGAAVFLHSRFMLADLDPIGEQHIYGLHAHPSGLDSLRDALLAVPTNPHHFVDTGRARELVELVKGAKIRPSVANRKINQLLLHPRPFAEGIGWQDFLAGHTLDTSLVRRVRFYLTSRAPEEELPTIRKAAEREFRLLQGIHHPGIANALDLVDHQWGVAVVFDHHRDAVRLDQWLTERDGKLTVPQRLQLVQDLAEIIDYAHSRRLAHRALHPRALFIRDADSPRPGLVVTDWQTGGRLAELTHLTQLGSSTDPASLELFFGNEVRQYQAPEAIGQTRRPGHQLDVFSLGALAYRIFAGADPAATPEELATAVRDSGLNLAGAVDGMPDSLVKMIYDATRGDPSQRTQSVAKFRSDLSLVWDELTTPDQEPVIDPLRAHAGDVLDGGLVVKDRLGTGATATALMVTQQTAEGKRDLVLKVARDEQHADRFATEARILDKLRDSRVAALVEGPVIVGGRTALLMESAGDHTLAEDLRNGRLAVELLARYGRDLLDIVAFLDSQGVWHRDLKPANLAARPRPKDKQPHLCVFDFSLAATPADQITAGTRRYLDPFLGPPRRMRFDAAAERFAAAVTLYEMATGTLPKWGDDAYPASVSDEVSLNPAAFEPAISDRFVAFFGKALARETADRFATLDEMTDAWRAIFQNIPEAEADVGLVLRYDSPLEAVGLTTRARSALNHLGVHNVGELLAYEPSALTRAKGVPDATRKEILAQARKLRELLPARADPADVSSDAERPTGAEGVEALCAGLLPVENTRNRKARLTLQVLLGQATGEGDTFLCWPSQSEVARAADHIQPQVSTLLRKQAKEWIDNPGLSTVRDEIVALLDARGAVMSSVELAEALLAGRGSYTSGAKRLPQAIGLVRAAVEAELARGGDARLAIHRFRSCDTVLVGREPDDVESVVTAADLLGYVVRLGGRAVELVAADPLPTRQRAVDELRAVPAPDDMPALGDLRLLQLAAAGSQDRADVNAQGQLYPVDMPIERTLRLAVGSLIGQRLSADAVRSRVRARFPRAVELPGRPELDDLLVACGVPLVWYPDLQGYEPPRLASSLTGTRMANTLSPMLGPDALSTAEARLAAVIDRHGFMVVLSPMKRLAPARKALLAKLRLTEVDVTALMLKQLRALGFPWEAIVAADSGAPTDADFRSLVELVQHHVVPAVTEALAQTGPVLITEAAPLARYGQLRLFQELADPTQPRPAARLLLVPARRPEPAMLDDWQLPLTSQSSQALWLPESWTELSATATRSDMDNR
jgi:serine/threonine protein kinase